MLVIKKLKSVTKKADLLDSSQVSDYPALINRNLISSVVRRVVWYPLVPLVVQFFNLFVETYAYVHSEVSYTLLLLCDIGLSLSGFLNALVFSQDIAVTRSFEDIKLNLWISNVNSFESHYPHRSHNKAITDEFSMLRKSNDIVELNVLNRNKADIIIKDIIIDDVNNDISNSDIINNDITNNDINNDISNNNIIKNDITNNIIINNVINNNFINNKNNNNSTDYRIINSTNNSLILQPSLLEWLKYMLLIKLFSVPKNSSQLISPKILSQVDSYAGNKIITLTGKDDSKQDITYDSRNNDQNIHLIPPEPIHLKDSSPVDLLSNSLSLTDPVIESSRSNQTNQINQANQINISNPNNINNPNNTHVSFTNVIDESNCPVDDDGQINIILVNGETEDLSQNNEKIKQMLKML
ncbi:14688_t:CDS:2 [Gigaspora margarita]|uniref:14688_t:CDS:1 n=1 Tax=Gigaspora margarita TaxID=4874 RepID=A0ABN7VBR6_GIGMA|nr:14688_t:CDS:2 [Gigaspora margarita]